MGLAQHFFGGNFEQHQLAIDSPSPELDFELQAGFVGHISQLVEKPSHGAELPRSPGVFNQEQHPADLA
jgi:hypothetical protein